MKKNIALLLITAMLMPTAAISVAAEEIPNIDKNIEADTDGITIYPNETIDTQELAAITSLTDKDGNDIPVEISKVNNSGTWKGSFVQDKPYLIRRADGKALETDKDYSLSIGDGVGAFKKIFRLDLIFSDDFSGEGNNSSADNMKMKWVNYNNQTEFKHPDVALEDGALYIDASIEGRLVPVNYEEMLDLKNCTAKFDVTAATGSDRKFAPTFTKREDTGDMCDSHTEYEVQNKQIRVRMNNCLVWDNNSGTYTPNAWHGDYTYDNGECTYGTTETYKFTGDGLKYSLYRNGVRLAANKETDEQYSAGGAFVFRTFGNSKVYLDNVIITRMYEYIDVKTDLSEPCDVNQESVTLIVGDAFDAATLTNESVSIKVGEVDFTDFTVEAAGNNKIKISFTDELQYKTKYTISLDNSIAAKNIRKYEYATTDFTTIAPPFDLTSFEEKAGEISAVISNNRYENAVNCIATVVCYDENNKILAISGGKYEIAIGDDVTISYAKPDTAVRAQCFVWDNFTDMSTLLEGYCNFE